MKNLCFLFFNLIFVCFSGFGQTNVSGNVSGIWTKANSPYIITADVTVPPGQTLTIQPGVEVRSADYADDLLYGTLVAQGTAADSIRFRGVYVNTSSTHGGTVYFLTGSSSSIMDYVIVERMGDATYQGAAIYVSQGETPIIRNTAVRFSEQSDFKVWAGGARNFSALQAVVDLDRGTGSANATMPKLGYSSYYRLIEDITVSGGQTPVVRSVFHFELKIKGRL